MAAELMLPEETSKICSSTERESTNMCRNQSLDSTQASAGAATDQMTSLCDMLHVRLPLVPEAFITTAISLMALAFLSYA